MYGKGQNKDSGYELTAKMNTFKGKLVHRAGYLMACTQNEHFAEYKMAGFI